MTTILALLRTGLVSGCLLVSLYRPLFADAAPAGGPSANGAWPTVRGDMARSSIASGMTKTPLHRYWVHKPALPPLPAWPPPAVRNVSAQSKTLSPSQIYDRAYHVVGADGRLYYGSSADDSVVCLDARTGSVMWRVFTEGPVRLAPTLWNGRVFAGSDDGHLYCLDAADGRLLWRRRGAPRDRRLPGNGRIISRWPVRAGIVVDAGTVYFTAGLFPSQGVYVCALNADDGSVRWQSESRISPQGYMAASADRLFIPSGRTPMQQVERATGKLVGKYGQSRSWDRDLVGGSYATLAGDRIATGPSEDGHMHFFKAAGRERLLRVAGRQVVAAGDVIYLLTASGVSALDRAACTEQKKVVTTWRCPVNGGRTMVLTDNALIVGGDMGVHVVAREGGKLLWQSADAGSVEGLAVCEGRLLVSARDGAVTCYAGDAAPVTAGDDKLVAAAGGMEHPVLSPPNAAILQTARREAACRRGYAFVIEPSDEALLVGLARETGLRVVGVTADANRAAALRASLAGPGLYGSRVVIHNVAPSRLPYQAWTADLVVMAAGCPRILPVREAAWQLVRPAGGVLVWLEGATGSVPVARFRRRGPLAGAGSWSHFYCDAGNTACGEDQLPAGPMDIQWFGRPGPRRMIDRHWKTAAPLYRDGRLFVTGNDYIAAVGAYNGAVLWERDVPGSIRTVAFKNSSNMVVTDEALYVAASNRCQVLDVRSGERVAGLAVPDELVDGPHEWGYLAHVDGLLYGSVTRAGAGFRSQGLEIKSVIWRNFQPVVTSTGLFALARPGHGVAWSYRPSGGVIVNPTLAVADGRVLFVESGNATTLADADGRLKLQDLLMPAFLVALDARTGRPLWRQAVDLADFHHIIFLSSRDDRILLTGTHYATVKMKRRIRYELKAYDARDGSLLWENRQVPDSDHVMDGDHGEQIQHPAIHGDTIYGPGFACRFSTGEAHEGWSWHKSHKCTTVSLSANCAFSRFAKEKNPYLFDLKTGVSHRLTLATRPGCWINMIPAGGMVLIPEGSAGCTCEYPLQTSLGLVPRSAP